MMCTMRPDYLAQCSFKICCLFFVFVCVVDRIVFNYPVSSKVFGLHKQVSDIRNHLNDVVLNASATALLILDACRTQVDIDLHRGLSGAKAGEVHC
jgi:hypothetical protein